MILKEFIDNLNEFVEENPKALNMQVVTSKDDEGNGYNQICDTPSVGNFDEDEKEFKSKEQINDPENEYETDWYPLNSVCIN